MATHSRTRSEIPVCPRCGYDQSGEIARWSEACPLRGVCVECGYEIEWADVLDASRRQAEGFFEHTHGPFRSLIAAWRTWLWTLMPWLFWRRVRLHHGVVVWKALIWLAVLYYPIQIGSCVLRSLGFGQSLPVFPGVSGIPWLKNALYALSPLVHPCFDIEDSWMASAPLLRLHVCAWPSPGWAGLAMSLAWPSLILMLPETRHAAKVRKVHVVRAACYGLAWCIVLRFVDVFGAAVSLILELMGLPNDWPSWNVRGMLSDPGWAMTHRPAPASILIGGWIALWWLVVLTRGFRLRHALFTWVVLSIAAAIIGWCALAAHEIADGWSPVIWSF